MSASRKTGSWQGGDKSPTGLRFCEELALPFQQPGAMHRNSRRKDQMKYIKMLGLLAVAAASLMALAGSASAASVTSSEGTTPNIVATSTNSKLDGSFVTVECSHSKVEGNVESQGAANDATPVGGAVDFLSFTGCNYTVTIGTKGSLAVHSTATTGDGTVTSSGASITIHTSVGSCVFTTSGTDIGTLDGKTGAVMNINSAKIPRTGGNFLCGSSGTWTGSYSVTSPATLEVH
jgi:hypothetical protein